MNSRERVLAALNHREPDRVPIDFSGHRSSGISAILYPKLRKYLKLPIKPVRVYDPIQQMAVVDEDMLDLFAVDTIELGRGFALKDEDWRDWILPDGNPCQMPAWVLPEREENGWVIRSKSGRIIAQMPDGALYFEQTHYPFHEEDDLDKLPEALDECMWSAIASPPGPLVSGQGGDERLIAGAKKLRESTDRAILGLFGGNLLELGQFLYRNDTFLMNLALKPKRMHEFLDLLVALHLENLESYLNKVGPYIDVIVFGDDLGMQTGPQMSPAMYREFFKPRHKKMWMRAKELADVKVNLHCCGGVRPILQDLIDAGLDAINPVQISCTGMESEQLKRDFGDKIVFWGGGCDTQHILPNSTPQEVKEHVRKQVEIFQPGGSFVFQQVHNILANVPPENVVAMFEALNPRRGAYKTRP
jgi:uroporphyrinogen decarboxylase